MQQQRSIHNTMDANVLRKVLRLIHCLQKERGSSCAYTVALKSSTISSSLSNDDFSAEQACPTFTSKQKQEQRHYKKTLLYALAVLLPARKETDICFSILLPLLGNQQNMTGHVVEAADLHRKAGISTSLHSLQNTLEKIRKLLPVLSHRGNDEEITNLSNDISSSSSSATTGCQKVIGFHRILVCYNALIQSVIHDHVLWYTRTDFVGTKLQKTKPKKAEEDMDRDSELFKWLRSPRQRRRRENKIQQRSRGIDNISTTTLLRTSQSHQALSTLSDLQLSSLGTMDDHVHIGQSNIQDNETIEKHLHFNSVVPSSDPGMLSLNTRQRRIYASEPPEILPPGPQIINCPETCVPVKQHLPNNIACNNKEDGCHLNVSSEHRRNLPESSSTTTFKYNGLQTYALTITCDEVGERDEIQVAEEVSNAVYTSSSSVSNSDTDDCEFDQISSVQPVRSNETEAVKLARLLRLLESFVRLKESTGVERATLCSILAAGKVESHLLVNDLVIEAENHRQQLESILQHHDCCEMLSSGAKTNTSSSCQSRPDGSILRLQVLINEMVAMPPAMERLQYSILQGFDLTELQKNEFCYESEVKVNNAGNHPTSSSSSESSTSSNFVRDVERHEKLWNMLTLYIDKLHSLELLLVEEIECSLFLDRKKNKNSEEIGVVLDFASSGAPHEGTCKNQANQNIDLASRSFLPVVTEEQATENQVPVIAVQANHINIQNVDDSRAVDATTNHKDVTASTETNKKKQRDASFVDLSIFQMAFGIDANDSKATTTNDPNLILSILQNTSPENIKQRLINALQQSPGGREKVEPLAGGAMSVNCVAFDESEKEDTQDRKADRAAPPTLTVVEDFLHQMTLSSPVFTTKEWEIDLYEIKFRKRIGQGAAGTTYLADWSGLPVAVKVASINEMGLEGWRTEVHALQKLHHPNIIRLLGSVCHPNPLTFCLVLEYCDAGDLSMALSKKSPKNFFFQVASGTAKGMSYLHSRGVIHRDIKPSNILLHGNIASGVFQVKVTDFGVATDFNNNSISANNNDRTAETGTYRWMAPEVIRHERYSQTADVYSFSIVLWQLITREEPFQDRGQIEAAAAVAIEQSRPPFPAKTPESIIQCIETCWSESPPTRLSFDQIITTLDHIEKTLCPQDVQWLQVPFGHNVYKKVEYCPSHTDSHEQNENAVDDEILNHKNNKIPSRILDPRQSHLHHEYYPHKKKISGLRSFFTKKYSN